MKKWTKDSRLEWCSVQKFGRGTKGRQYIVTCSWIAHLGKYYISSSSLSYIALCNQHTAGKNKQKHHNSVSVFLTSDGVQVSVLKNF